jgi:hypothetical protein
MTSFQQNSTLGIAAILLWQPCVLSRVIAPIDLWMMLGGVVIATLLIFRAYFTRRRAALIVGLAVLATAWISYGCWRLLSHARPLHGGGIDPFAGAVAVWAVFSFLLGVGIWGMAVWVLVKRSKEHLKWRLAFALGACLVFTSNYFFKMTKGI